ncbi:MAG: MarR family transcriptional regulator [Bacilli bacterium]|nr:MarR family transcriptional regulator [Bacilli bacterium]
MTKVKSTLNELLVNVFNYIVNIEGIILKNRGLPISMNEMHVLEAIDKAENATMSQIANSLLITAGTLTIAINRLVKKGYVIREHGDTDRRKIFVTLTEKGQEVKKIHDEFHREMIDHVIGQMNITEESELLQALDNLQTYFREKYHKEIENRNEK